MAEKDVERNAELLRQFKKSLTGMSVEELGPLVDQILAYGRDLVMAPIPRPSLRHDPLAEPATYRIRIDLNQAKPPIWRRLELRSDLTLDVVHQIIQATFGWMDYHLHRFALGNDVFDLSAELFLCPYDVEEGEEEGVPASEVRLDETLSAPGDRLRYCYDYGDSWDLTIKLESVDALAPDAPPAVCLDGRRAAPPEDCGGIRDARSLGQLLPDPAYFDVDEVNAALMDPYLSLYELGVRRDLVDLLNRLRGTVEGDRLVSRATFVTNERDDPSAKERTTALRAFLWFLDRIGDDGLPLTSAGYLKPVDVLAAAAVVPGGADWIGMKNREIDTVPVLWFRERLQALGLTRKYRGRLLLTRAGAAARGDSERLWRHVASRLPLGKPGSAEQQAGLIALLLNAAPVDEPALDATLAPALTALGWRQDGSQPVTERGAASLVRATLDVLDAVGMDQPSRQFGTRRSSTMAAALARRALVDNAG